MMTSGLRNQPRNCSQGGVRFVSAAVFGPYWARRRRTSPASRPAGWVPSRANSRSSGSFEIAARYRRRPRPPPLAISWVLYPRYAMDDPFKAGRKARSLLPRAGLMIALASLPLGLGAGYLLPLVYGEAFRAAVVPAQILIVGLSVQGVAGVLTAYFYGTGRPGLNSVAMGGGLLLTLALDLLLIPRFGATGAAVASTCAYLTSAVALLVAFWMVTRKSASRAPLSRAVLEAPTR